SGGNGLNPLLDPASGSGAICNMPGDLTHCPNYGVCRFYTSTEARCEDPGMGLGLHQLCSSSSECDVLFVCYDSECRSFCHLGTIECGAVSDCVDVGWTGHDIGVCSN